MKTLNFWASGALSLAILCTSSVAAQGRPEVRADAIFSQSSAFYLGAGILFPVGTYLRSGVVAAVGVADGSSTIRADLINLFHADPFRESKWGPYGGGGISFRRDSNDDRTNAFLLAVLGVEGPPKHGLATAFEVGLGGGVRASLIVRRADTRRR